MPNATSDDVEHALKLPHQSVSPRFTELREDGYIEYARDSHGNRVTKATRRNRSAYVHRLTQKGRDAVRLGIPIQRRRGDTTSARSKHNPLSAAAFQRSDFSSMRLEVLKYLAR